MEHSTEKTWDCSQYGAPTTEGAVAALRPDHGAPEMEHGEILARFTMLDESRQTTLIKVLKKLQQLRNQMVSADLLTFCTIWAEHYIGEQLLQALDRSDLVDLIGIDDIAPRDICETLRLRCDSCNASTRNFEDCILCQGHIEEPTRQAVSRYKNAFLAAGRTLREPI